ncbi:MAG: hypothetical protein H6Q91_3136 [Deltaproteobacteria bacterium]|nr:hypothetical protein [Deltaproteobacteria bacterium]
MKICSRPGLVSAVLVAATTLGCGTTLELRSLAIPAEPLADCTTLADPDAKSECRRFNAPGGIVTNQRASYQVRARSQLPLYLAPSALKGVDQNALLVSNYRRQPFASGKLALTLDAAQTVKTIGIESEPGELQAAQSLSELAAARAELRAARKKAKKE